jgi:hypothetical protein
VLFITEEILRNVMQGAKEKNGFILLFRYHTGGEARNSRTALTDRRINFKNKEKLCNSILIAAGIMEPRY